MGASRKYEQAKQLRQLKQKQKRSKREAKDPNYHLRIAKQRQASMDEAERRSGGRNKKPTLSQIADSVGMTEIAKALRLEEDNGVS